MQNISHMTDRQSLTNTIFNNNYNNLSNMPPAAFQLQPKLNPFATSFTPNARNQLQLLHKQQQDSMTNLQVFSVQLNALQLLNAQNPSNESLKQYQNVYQQYNMEITNALLLHQCINNLNALTLTNNTEAETETEAETDTTSASVSASNRLETIAEEDEGEGNECDDGNEGRMNIDIIGEQLADTNHNKSFKKFPNTTNAFNSTNTDTDTRTDTAAVHVPGERKHTQRASESDKIKKQIRGILNKMTAENFDKLSQEMANLLCIADMAFIELSKYGKKAVLSQQEIVIAQKAQFKALIKLILKCILEKAITDTVYTNQYARLCYSLYLYAEHNELKKKLLREQLLSLSHSIFKKARNNEDNGRFIGIIVMIGELFRYGLISWNVIMSGIFEELLPPQTPLDIEAVCKLLKTAGHDFDRHHYAEINVVIQQLSSYCKRYDFRARCFVREIQEIRGNDWQQKREEIKNKKREENNKKRSKTNGGQGRWRNHNKTRSGYNDYQSYGRRRAHKTRGPTAEFIKDVTLPDRSHYAPHKILTKTWAMKNAGDAPWGHDVELVYFKGDETLSLERRYPVMNVASGQCINISATIKTPTAPGRYCTYFRLQKNGKYFGPRVWVDIIVSDIVHMNHSNDAKLTNDEANHNVLQCQ